MLHISSPTRTQRARPIPLVVAGLLAVSACSGTSDGAPPASIAAPVSSETVDAAGGAGAPATVTTTEPGAATSTSTTSTTLPPPPPPPPAGLSTAAIDDDAKEQRLATAGDTIAGADGRSMIVVGSTADAPGSPRTATVHVSSDSTNFSRLDLDDLDAAESFARSIDRIDEHTVVAGEIVGADGRPTAVMWTSTDRATSFGPPVEVVVAPSAVADVVVWDGGVAVTTYVTNDQGLTTLAVSTSTDGAIWTRADLEVPGIHPAIGGIARLGERLVVTGSFDLGPNLASVSWTSDDGGASFTINGGGVLAASSSVGPPSLIDGGLVAMAARSGNATTRLVTSTDGIAWAEIELSVTLSDRPRSLAAGATGTVIAHDGGYAMGTTEQVGAVALVGRDGVGTLTFAPDPTTDLFGAPIVLEVGGALRAVASSTTGWRVATWDPASARWTTGGGVEPVSDGPASSSVRFATTSTGVVANASIYPRVTRIPGGGFSWEGVDGWFVEDGDSWIPIPRREIRARTTDLVSSGALDLAVISVKDDPGDDDLSGPIGGTDVSVRPSGGEWGERTTLLTGPGGDYVDAATATATGGFLVVGSRNLRDEVGNSTSSPVLMEYADGAWVDLPIGVDLGPDFSLSAVAETDDGRRAASGSSFDGAEYRSVVLSPGADGVWNQVALTDAPPDFSIDDLTAVGASLQILADEGTGWSIYTSRDDGSFARTALDFGTGQVSLTGVVDVDGATVLVGTSNVLGVSTLAVWRLDASGALQPVSLDGPPTATGLRVTDAVVASGATEGGRLSIGVVARHQSTVVRVDLS